MSQPNQQINPNDRSYSNILKADIYPSKHHAIILQKHENIEFTEYILALRDIIDLKQITDAYPMSFSRICVYLKTKDLADEIVENHKYIIIKGHQIQIRKLVTPSRRLIISVPANIPNELLIQHLTQNNIKLTSAITRLKLTNPELIHINSGRRQAYYVPDPEISPPDSFLLQYEDEIHRIFLNTEKCEFCNKDGHTKERCRGLIAITQSDIASATQQQNNDLTDETTRKRLHTDTSSSQEEEQATTKKTNTEYNIESVSTENTLTENIMESQQSSTQMPPPDSQIIPTSQPVSSRKLKTITKFLNLDETLQTMKPIITLNPEKFPMSYSKFEKFLQDLQKNIKIENIMQKHKIPPDSITKMLQILYDLPDQNTKVKTTITKLKNRMTRAPGYESSSEETS